MALASQSKSTGRRSRRGDASVDPRAAPDRIGTALHTRFNQSFTNGALVTPERSAAASIVYLGGGDSGSSWDVSDVPARI